MIRATSCCDAPTASVQQSANTIDIIITEAKATIRYVLPSMIAWIWRKYICDEIKTIPIQATADKITKTAYLNIHGNIKDKAVCPVILSHGDFSHPSTMLHLADLSLNAGHPTFSLYIPGVEDNKYFALNDSLMKQAIDKIEGLVKNFSGILGAGHSKGAMLLAHREFVALDPRLKGVCSIAGGLKKIHEGDSPDHDLIAIVKKIYQGILDHPEKPVVQIIPKDDWNASFECMAPRPHEYCYTVPGMHLSGLYSNETKEHFSGFIKNGNVD